MEKHVVKTVVFASGRSITRYLGIMAETDIPAGNSTTRADTYYDSFDTKEAALNFVTECVEEERNSVR